MSERTCKVEGCDTPVPAPGGARGMCGKHYCRWKNHGDPLVVHRHGWSGKSAEDRFWPKVNKDGPVPDYAPHLGPCWLWTAGHAEGGYGTFWSSAQEEREGGHLVPAHRFAYELLVGPIPAGLHLDHLCRVPACVRPAHLEPVTLRENVLRGIAPPAEHARKETCPADHPYDVVRPDGKRRCSICDKRNARERLLSKELVTPCACGCGTLIPELGRRGQPRRYVLGHNMRDIA
jgi:HNH endonuclease